MTHCTASFRIATVFSFKDVYMTTAECWKTSSCPSWRKGRQLKISTIRVWRTSNYMVKQIGVIGCFWTYGIQIWPQFWHNAKRCVHLQLATPVISGHLSWHSGWWLAPSQDACVVVKTDRNQIFDKALLYIVVRVYSYCRQPYRKKIFIRIWISNL